jgi:hypothetical protein
LDIIHKELSDQEVDGKIGYAKKHTKVGKKFTAEKISTNNT